MSLAPVDRAGQPGDTAPSAAGSGAATAGSVGSGLAGSGPGAVPAGVVPAADVPAGPAAPVDSPARAGGAIARSAVLSMAALVALGLTRLLHGSLVSHATDQRTYGRVGAALALATVLSLLLPAGLASAAARFIPYHQGRGEPAAVAAVYRLLRRLGAVAALGLGLAAGVAGTLLLDLDTVDAGQAVALCAAFSWYSVQKSTLYGFGEVAAYVRLELACAVLAVGATVALVLAGGRLYLAPLALGYTVFGLGASHRLRGRARPSRPAPDPPQAGADRAGIWRYALLACLGTLSSTGFLQGTQLLATRFAAPAEVAYVAAAVTLVAPAYFLPRALGMVLFPAMARAHGAGDLADVRRHADLSTRLLVAVLAPPFAAGLLLAPQLLTVFGGERYADGAGVLRLLLAASYLAVIQVAAVNTLSSGEHVRVPVTAAVTGCLTGLAVVAALGGPFGAVGVGVGYLVGTAVTAAVPLAVVWRVHRMPWGRPLARAGAALAGALVAGQLTDGLGPAGAGARALLDAALAGAALLLGAALLRTDLAALWRSRRG